MRWFTRERYEDPDFDGWDAIVQGYATYLDTIRGQLPDQLRRLTDINLHDAGIEAAEIDFEGRVARIRFLTVGDQRLVTCRYDDADFGESNLKYLELAIEAIVPRRDDDGHIFGWKPLANVLYDEVTIENDRHKHAFLLYPFGDFALTFGGFGLNIERGFERHSRETKPRFTLRNVPS